MKDLQHIGAVSMESANQDLVFELVLKPEKKTQAIHPKPTSIDMDARMDMDRHRCVHRRGCTQRH